MQIPLEQVGATTFCDEQPALHAPQCVVLVDTFVSQPAAALSQSARPVWQAQAPFVHCMPVTVAQSVP